MTSLEILNKNMPEGITLTGDLLEAVLKSLQEVATARLINEDYTHIAICLDRSGSMDTIATDIIGGFNAFIKAQKALPGKATVSLIQFDNIYETVHSFVDIKEIPELTSDTFVPRHSTALNDSFYQLIEETETAINSMLVERPGRVLFISLTDGAENASTKHSTQELKAKIDSLKDKNGWVFSFIGAEQDSFAESQARGMNAKDTMNFQKSSWGVKGMYDKLNQAAGLYRSASMDSASQAFNLSDEGENPDFKFQQ